MTDNYQAVAQAVFEYVVVYDPQAGFITGAGWITSPPGAYQPNPDLAGDAKFGVVAKIKKGDTIPSGNLQFRLGDFEFESLTYDWLVISGSKATLQGTGTINDRGKYGYTLTILNEKSVAGCPDGCLRLRVWDAANSSIIIYDNERSRSASANPVTPVLRGNIKIQQSAVKLAAVGGGMGSDAVIIGSPPYVTLQQLLGDVSWHAALYLPAVER